MAVDSCEKRAARFLSSSAFVHSSTEVIPRLAMICCVTGSSCELAACFSMTARSSATFLTLYSLRSSLSSSARSMLSRICSSS